MTVLTQTAGTDADKLLMVAVMLGVLAFAFLGLWAWRRHYGRRQSWR